MQLSILFAIIALSIAHEEHWEFASAPVESSEQVIEDVVQDHTPLQPQQQPNFDFVNYYFPMLRDDVRNKAFLGAIEKVVKHVKNETNDNFLVLDIGAGQGLLSMMAARAGAKRVYSVEMHNELAKLALEIIRLNGYENTITYINKQSFALEIGEGKDIPEKADILLSENLDSYFFGEQMLVTIKHAKENLLKPNAKIIPAGGAIYAQVIESTFGFGKDSIVEGFDMSPFRHHRLTSSFGFNYESHPHLELTDSFQAFSFDFEKDDLVPENNTRTLEVIADGCINGFALWWSLDCDREKGFSFTIGPKRTTHWEQVIMLLSGDMIVSKGDQLKITSHHDTKTVWFDLDKIIKD